MEWLSLLAECGVDIPLEDWNREHPLPITAPITDAPEPTGYVGDVPCYSSTQVDYCPPECWGIDVYHVEEDVETAHPYVLSWKDEQYYRGNFRPTHRYSRIYRLTWTLAHVLGYYARADPEIVERLRSDLGTNPVLRTRRAYEWVRAQLRSYNAPHMYLSIPALIRMLGGPSWHCSNAAWHAVKAEAEALHRAFDAMEDKGRKRFPKMQYVLLRLLDKHGVAPPYKVLWARTSIKRRQLAQFLDRLS